MRLAILAAALLSAPLVLAEEGAAPAPAPAPAPVSAPVPAAAVSDPKTQAKELDAKVKAIREQTVKDDADLAKLKAEADDARKRFETALEAKLKDNAEYQDAKKKLDELRPPKKEHKEHKDKTKN